MNLIKEKYKDEFSYEYLVGLLNSKVYDKYFKIIGKEMGKKIFDYYPNRVMKLKIFKDENYKKIESLSKEIIFLSRKKLSIINELESTSKKLAISSDLTKITTCENVMEIQDKNISLLKEKHYLENKIDFIENIIEEIIKKSLNLNHDTNLD